VAWIVRLVKIGGEGEEQATDVIEINRPEDLGDIADLGLTLADAKLLLAGLQQEIVTAQARDHAVWRPACRRCGGVCRVKDYRDHSGATLSAMSRCGFRDFAAPRVAGSRVAWTGQRIADRHRSWSGFRRIFAPS
jgi:hypothetical protein